MDHKQEHETVPEQNEEDHLAHEPGTPQSSIGRILNLAVCENNISVAPSSAESRNVNTSARQKGDQSNIILNVETAPSCDAKTQSASPCISPSRGRKMEEESVTTGISGLTVASLRPEVAVTQSLDRIAAKYVISETLGKGTFGEVSLATSTATGEKLAVKKMRHDNLEKLQAFKNEFEIAKRLQHPNIVKLHDMFMSDEMCYLVMDLCTGGDLVQFVESHNEYVPAMKMRQVYFPPEEGILAKLIWQMLQSVRYLHYHSIVHRDIKMENFLLSSKSSGDVKLIDFGFAKVLQKDQLLKGVCGSAGYIAPEVLDKARGYGFPCDAWSIGVVAYLLFTCEFPIPNDDRASNEDLLKQANEHEIVYKSSELPDIPEVGKGILKMLLQKDPSKRSTPKEILASNRWLRTVGRGKHADCCCTIS